MPYDDRSFFDGLAFGLAATAGRLMGPFEKTLMTGTGDISRYPYGDFDTLVSKMYIQSPYPFTVVYEYGPDRNAPERVFRRVAASKLVRTVGHAVHLPETVKATDFHYNVYLLERRDMRVYTPFWAGFAWFPYHSDYPSKWWYYPGKPELQYNWYTQNGRNTGLLEFPEGEGFNGGKVDAGI